MNYYLNKSAYYLDTLSSFWSDLEKNNFTNQMREGGKLPPNMETAEVRSWQENAKVISTLMKLADLPDSDDVYIAFEYAAPVGGRVDCVLFGTGLNGKKNVVLIELKQWSKENLEVFSCYGKNCVDVYVGGSTKTVDHPSEQVEHYKQHFRNFISIFDTEDYVLTSLAYCYNYESDCKPECLFDPMFTEILKSSPLYTKDTTKELAQFLHDMLCGGDGKSIATTVANAEHKPTKALIEAAANMMNNPSDNTFVLLGEQDGAYKKFWSILKNTLDNKEKSVFIVKGGAGTGKTVIALKILSELYREAQAKGKDCNAYYVTRSTALAKQLGEVLGTYESGAQDLIKKTFMFRPACFKESEIDVLLVDEAHRVQEKSNDQTDGALKRMLGVDSVYCPLNQTLSLIYCAKTTVFFIDDHQAVKNQEIGSSKEIEYFAQNYQSEYKNQIDRFTMEFNANKPKVLKDIATLKQELQNDEITDEECKRKAKLLRAKERDLEREKGLEFLTTDPLPSVSVYDYELTTQFRCQGADRFVSWVDNVLYNDVPNDKKIKLDRDDFDFQIIGTPLELERKIRSLNNQDSTPKVSARLVAGWCWDWSDKTAENGDLKKEVQIGDWAMPWETKANPSKAYKLQYARDADFWAKDAQGINQVGCIYSAQGFEFDYVGVIFGPDITYDKDHDCLICHPKIIKREISLIEMGMPTFLSETFIVCF